MYKFFLIVFMVSSLSATVVDGVAVIVKGQAITLYDITKEMKLLHVDVKKATESLIRKKLEAQETKERKITVSTSEVYEDIKQTAARNNMSVSDFYAAVRESNGLSSTELKESVKQRILSQKLYGAIAYSKVTPPTEQELKSYFDEHKSEFEHPSSFEVTIYQAKDSARLQEKVNNPMFYAPDIATQEQTFEYNKLAPELAAILSKTPLNSFTQIISDGRGGYVSFYVKSKVEGSVSFESVKDQIANMLMAKQREEVLGEYFARLRHNADIKTLRLPE